MIRAKILTVIFWILLTFRPTGNWSVRKLNDWATMLQSLRYRVAWNLQGKISSVTGYPICSFCSWVESSGETHTFCEIQAWESYEAQFRQTPEEIAAEIALGFKQIEDERDVEEAAAYQQYYDELEQKRHESGYYDDDGYEDDPPEPREVNVGGHIGSLLIYE